MTHQVQRVVYVDSKGEQHNARTLRRADELGRTRLLVSYRNGKGLAVVDAPESGAKAAGTWHHPDQAS